MKYRKKPVVIEAFKLGVDAQPDWFTDAVTTRAITTHNVDGRWRGGPDYCLIKTLEGEMRGEFGDFIIQGVKGEIYPCKPDIFEATYEPAAPVDHLVTPKYWDQLTTLIRNAPKLPPDDKTNDPPPFDAPVGHKEK